MADHKLPGETLSQAAVQIIDKLDNVKMYSTKINPSDAKELIKQYGSNQLQGTYMTQTELDFGKSGKVLLLQRDDNGDVFTSVSRRNDWDEDLFTNKENMDPNAKVIDNKGEMKALERNYLLLEIREQLNNGKRGDELVQFIKPLAASNTTPLAEVNKSIEWTKSTIRSRGGDQSSIGVTLNSLENALEDVYQGRTTSNTLDQRLETMQKSEQKEKVAVFEEKTYLAVPYREKDQAKKAGAKWDKDQKSWYAPEGASKEALRDWTIENKEIKALDQNQDKFLDVVSEFKAALEKRGLKITGDPIMDGKIHRVPVEGDKGKKLSGAYMAYNDGRPAGYIENFKTGLKENWKAMGSNFSNNLTPEKIAEQKALNEAREAQRAKDLEDKHEAISEKVSNEFGSLKEAPNDHAYLKTKGVKAHGLKLDKKNNLVMPLKDLNGKQWTAQKINSNFKGLEKGGKKAGHFHIIGANNVKDLKEVIIVEGYATGASVYEATGTPVVVAVDSGNLKPVAEAIRDKYPEIPMVIAGDNDIQKELKAKSATEKAKANVGKIKAAAAAACNAFSIIPQLTQEEIKAGVTDFNDLSKSRGPKEVKKIIDAALNQAKSKTQTIQKEVAKAKNLDQNKKNQREVVRKQTIGMSR